TRWNNQFCLTRNRCGWWMQCIPRNTVIPSAVEGSRRSYLKPFAPGSLGPGRTGHFFAWDDGRLFAHCRHNNLSPMGGAPMFEKKRSEEHTSELQSLAYLVCRLL